MSEITEAAFSIAWLKTYAGSLDAAKSRLVTRAGYASVFDPSTTPWGGEPGWSNFWSKYIGAPTRKTLPISGDTGFEYLLPICFFPTTTYVGPDSSIARFRLVVYPGTIAAVAAVIVHGVWPIERFASDIVTIRSSKTWSADTPGDRSADRSIDGLAQDMVAPQVELLGCDSDASMDASTITVVAPVAGNGDSASFDVTQPDVKACLADLVSLGSATEYNPELLLSANDNLTHDARVYGSTRGHVIWKPTAFGGTSEESPVTCLLRNHTDLVVHIAALSKVVTWASERLETGDIPAALQPLVSRAVTRLEKLRSARGTYRAGIAKARIDPLSDKLRIVGQAGW